MKLDTEVRTNFSSPRGSGFGVRELTTVLLLVLLSGCSVFAVPGTPCRKHEECGLKDGYCSKAEICTRECSENNPCPDNSSCFVGVGRSVCLPNCERDEDCLPNFRCAGEVPATGGSPGKNVCRLKSPLSPPPS